MEDVFVFGPGFVQMIVTSGIVNVVLLGVLGALAKTYLEKKSEEIRIASEAKFQKSVDEYRIRLEKEREIELEGLKTQLRERAFKYEIRLQQLHEKRIDALVGIYSSLEDAYRKGKSYVHWVEPAGGKSRETRLSEVIASLEAAYETLISNKLFLPKDQYQAADEVLKEIEVLARGFYIKVDTADMQDTTAWLEIWNRVNTGIPELTDSLANSFRGLIDPDDGC